MGLKTIMSARKILLLANGIHKSKIISELFNLDISTKLPASILKLHEDVTVILDKKAASLINQK